MSSKKPILFSTHMVQAILEGRKTITRRILKSSHESGLLQISKAQHTLSGAGYYCGIMPESLDWDERSAGNILCPYGEVGSVLWVREEHYRYGHWEPVPDTLTATGRQKWAFVADTNEVRYFDNPPANFRKGRHHKDPGTSIWHKRLARFMPYKACRLFLKVTDRRVERLQDITEEDAIAEGIQKVSNHDQWFNYLHKENAVPAEMWVRGSVESFRTLWESINGPGSWKRNDWVWVVSFEKTDKPV